jgi:DNA-directed RNA polymerase specialized sigma24 family protein
VSTGDARERFTFDLERIAPDWPDVAEREAEWSRVVGHYLPRLRDHFTRETKDADLANDVVSHILRRALLKLHELGSPHAAWQWFTRTGMNHLTDLRRRRPVEARRLDAYQLEQDVHQEVEVPVDVVTRLAEALDGGDGGAAGDGDGGGGLGGRVPISRAEWEARLAALPAEDRQLLELIEVEGKTHAEAAADLGLPTPAASRKRHSRARHYLRTGTKAP